MIQKFSKLLFVAVFAVFLSSCGSDTIIPGATDPKISLGTTSGDVTVKPCEVVTINVVASKGDADLNAIEVTEDGTKVNIDRITWKGSAVGANPILLVGSDRSSVAADLSVKANCSVGAKTITVSIIDASNVKASATKKVTSEAISPSNKYNGPDPVVASIGISNLFSFDVTKGSGKIVSVEVQENSLKITDASRLTFDGKAFITNPESLTAAYQDGFTAKSIGVKNSVVGNFKYKFIFTDEFGLTTEKEVNVSVGSPITFSENGVLLNQAGPSGTGGLDLDNAKGTGSNDANAEIADLGVDLSLPTASNWRQSIKGINGTELKVLKRNAELEITFDLANVTLSEQIPTYHAKGKDIASGQKIVEGDVITAKKGTKYYIFEVAKVLVTTGDNTDSYSLNIKH
jgi:hypothetical protein